MKKISVLCLSIIILLITSINVFAAEKNIDSKYEQAKLHAERCHEKMTEKKAKERAKRKNNVSLMGTSEIPDTLLPLSEDVVIYGINGETEIYFENPSESYYFDIAVQNIQSGEFEDDAYIGYDTIEDYDTYETLGIVIDYIDIYGEPGEYNFYIYDEDGNYYEPVKFILNGFELYQDTFSTDVTYQNMYLEMYETDEHYSYPHMETITLTGEDADGNQAFCIENLVPYYVDEWGMDIRLSFPSDLNGQYLMDVILNKNDGTQKSIGKTWINIGNYLSVQNFDVLNSNVTSNTQKLYSIVTLNNIPDKSDKFRVVLEDYYENELASTSEYKISNIENYDEFNMLFEIDLPDVLEPGSYYDVYLEYSGNKIYDEKYTDFIEVSEYAVNYAQQISETQYKMETEGVSAGTYNVVSESGSNLGTITVYSNGSAVMETTEEIYIPSYENLTATGENGEFDFCMDYYSWYDEMPEIPSVGYVNMNYVMPGTTTINGLKMGIISDKIIDVSDITSIELINNEEVVSTASDIEFMYGYLELTGNGEYYYENSFIMNFENINTTFKGGFMPTIKVNMGDKSIEHDISVVEEAYNFKYQGIGILNVIEAFKSLLYDETYECFYECNYTSYNNISLKINWTNSTDCDINLYRYNEESGTFELYSKKNLSDFAKQQSSFGFGYSYNIELSAEPGYFYFVNIGNYGSRVVYVEDKLCVGVYDPWFVYENEYVSGQSNYLWMNYAGIDFENDNVKAYYIDNNKKTYVDLNFECYNSNEADVYFKDISDLENIDNVCLHFECNGKAAGSINVFNVSDKKAEVLTYSGYNKDGQYTDIYGTNLNKIENPVLKISKVKDFKTITVEDENVISKSISFDSYKIDIGNLNLDEGKYCVYICDGDNIVSYPELIVISGDESITSSLPISLKKIKISGSTAEITLTNSSDDFYSDAVVVLASYNSDETMSDIKLDECYINASGETTVNIKGVSADKEYRVFVWESKRNIKPIME